ncbi:MAG: YlqF/YawG family GTPase [Aminivibrio sp.]
MARTVWYPGHMAKGKRKLAELAGKLDIILEVRDARAPLVTSSPIAADLEGVCPIGVVMAKEDLAEKKGAASWLSWFASRGQKAWAVNLLKPRLEALRRDLAALAPAHREVRLAVVGIPNVGKSMLLNALVGKSSAPVGGIPGITRGVSWYKGRGVLVVDSPGILDPRGGEEIQRCLAWLGCSKADIIGGYDVVALDLISVLRQRGLWAMIEEKWKVPAPPEAAGEEVLEALAQRLGCLVQGGGVDTLLAARRFIEAFSTGRFGPVTLEFPGDSPWT